MGTTILKPLQVTQPLSINKLPLSAPDTALEEIETLLLKPPQVIQPLSISKQLLPAPDAPPKKIETLISKPPRVMQALIIDKLPLKAPDSPPADCLETGQSAKDFRCTVRKYPLPDCLHYKVRIFKLSDGDYLVFRALDGDGLLGTGASGRCHLGRSPTGEWLCFKEVSFFREPLKRNQEPFSEEYRQKLQIWTQEEAMFASKLQLGLAPWFYLERSDRRKAYVVTPLAATSLWDVSRTPWQNFVPPPALRQIILQQLVADYHREDQENHQQRNESRVEWGCEPLPYIADEPELVNKIITQIGGYSPQKLFPRQHYHQWQAEAAWSLLRSVTADLLKLHQHGILHNDVRASNIMVGGEDHLPHLIDFNCTFNLQQQLPWDNNSRQPDGAPPALRAPELTGDNMHGLFDVRKLRVKDWLKSDVYALAWAIFRAFVPPQRDRSSCLRISRDGHDAMRRMLSPNNGLMAIDMELLRYWELRGKHQQGKYPFPNLTSAERARVDRSWEIIEQLPAPLPQLLAAMLSVRPQDRPSSKQVLAILDKHSMASPAAGHSWWHFYQPEKSFAGGSNLDFFAHLEQVATSLQQQQELAVGAQTRLIQAEQLLIPAVAVPPPLNWFTEKQQGKPKDFTKIEQDFVKLCPGFTIRHGKAVVREPSNPATAADHGLYKYMTWKNAAIGVGLGGGIWAVMKECFFRQSGSVA